MEAWEASAARAEAAAGLDGAPRPWIAVHLRRGDACREGAYMGRTCSGGDEYAAACARVGRAYGFGSLLVATDSDSALSRVGKGYEILNFEGS